MGHCRQSLKLVIGAWDIQWSLDTSRASPLAGSMLLLWNK
jgi:hypothetical protein